MHDPMKCTPDKIYWLRMSAKLNQLATYKTWGHLKCIKYTYKTSDTSWPDIYEKWFYPENLTCRSTSRKHSHVCNCALEMHNQPCTVSTVESQPILSLGIFILTQSSVLCAIITFINHQTKIKFHLSAYSSIVQLNDLNKNSFISTFHHRI